ncbi:MAG: assimilatory sulfite reductase (NADPH) flavoprotein subunit [Steroidobacteraceae bacterium]|jgi:sulfite reductase (NADPH) flavoprotein alpha-component|nr:assimilatory sulfite reductase (NADPH) flavoprotein subunit [Steroidobacteraceae bacterium]
MSAASPLPAAPLLLDPERAQRLDALVADLDPLALAYVSGYAAALAAERSRATRLGAAVQAALPSAAPAARAEPVPVATVLYASQTGNGRRVAERLGRELEAAGVAARVVSAADFAPKHLADERTLYAVVSTHGDGEPPDDARALFDLLAGRRAPKLPNLAFAVLALGDSSYPKFCATGRWLDERLAELGARRLQERVECDVDLEPKAGPWVTQAIAAARATLAEHARPEPVGALAPRIAVVTPLRPASVAATREQPGEAEVLANQRITARGAERDVRHLELALPEGRLDYEPGDALGLRIENSPTSVERVLELVRLDAGTTVTLDGATAPLAEWLTKRREVTRVARGLVEQLARRTGDPELARWLTPEGGESLRRALKELQVADLLKRWPADWDADSLVAALHPLSPRLYSIASSRRAVGDEAHLTIALLEAERDGERRTGAASAHVAALAAGDRVKAYVEPNPRFRLPADGHRDVIMIGPGTGVAPFRGFLQARVADGARGRHWLFYGGRHLDSDFLYQLEWLEALRKKQLHRLDVAFSRDQAEKVYVQHRIREHGAEFWRWLEAGAHVYVCGDAERMAPDVHAALLDVIATHGGRDAEGAREYVAELTAQKRYARDVY